MKKFATVTACSILLIALAMAAYIRFSVPRIVEASSFTGWTVKPINKYAGRDMVPIGITKLSIKGKDLSFGESLFSRSHDLSDSAVTIRGFSAKVIQSIQLDLVVRDPQTNAFIGYSPAAGFGGDIPLGTEVTVNFSTDKIASLAKSLAAQHISLKNAALEVGDVSFADGTRWSRGYFLRQDTINPQLWVVTGREDQVGYLRKAVQNGFQTFNASSGCASFGGQVMSDCGAGCHSFDDQLSPNPGFSKLGLGQATCGLIGEPCSNQVYVLRVEDCLAN
jgi:hypothetical protein